MRIQDLWGMLLIFTQAAMGLLFQDPVVCNFNKNNQCYVAEGQQLHLPMPKEERFYVIFTDKTSNRSIIRYGNKRKPTSPRLTTWQFVTDNSMLILSSAKRNDSGTYTLETSSSYGKSNGIFTLQLNIEAQVSSVEVSYSCLSSGLMKMDCSADGDHLRFSWTTDLTPVNQLEDGNSSLLLGERHGNVTCHVENHVSSAQRSTQLQPCLETNFTQSNTGFMVFVSVWLFEIIILLSLLVGAFYIYTRIYRKPENNHSLN